MQIFAIRAKPDYNCKKITVCEIKKIVLLKINTFDR